MKKNAAEGMAYQDYCFIKFRYLDSVQKALAHPDHIVLNNLVL